jgi:hypothetical protein
MLMLRVVLVSEFLSSTGHLVHVDLIGRAQIHSSFR